jgi:hypothetical protein
MTDRIPLYEAPRRCRIRYCGGGASAGSEYDFCHIDGAYALAYDDDGGVVYFNPTSIVQVIDDYMYELWEK